MKDNSQNDATQHRSKISQAATTNMSSGFQTINASEVSDADLTKVLIPGASDVNEGRGNIQRPCITRRQQGLIC